MVLTFVDNARPMLDSLTALWFARLRISTLEDRVRRVEGERDGFARQALKSSQGTATSAVQHVDQVIDITDWHQQYRRANRERWYWRLGVGTGLATALYLQLRR